MQGYIEDERQKDKIDTPAKYFSRKFRIVCVNNTKKIIFEKERWVKHAHS